MRLQDQVRPVPIPQIVSVLESSLNRKITDVFREFTPTPIAAGSVAQVHRGCLHSGQVVAVKILRPGARAKAERSLSMTKRIMHIISLLPGLKHIPISEAFEEIARTMLSNSIFKGRLR